MKKLKKELWTTTEGGWWLIGDHYTLEQMLADEYIKQEIGIEGLVGVEHIWYTMGNPSVETRNDLGLDDDCRFAYWTIDHPPKPIEVGGKLWPGHVYKRRWKATSLIYKFK